MRSNAECERVWGNGMIHDTHVCLGNGQTGACNVSLYRFYISFVSQKDIKMDKKPSQHKAEPTTCHPIISTIHICAQIVNKLG